MTHQLLRVQVSEPVRNLPTIARWCRPAEGSRPTGGLFTRLRRDESGSVYAMAAVIALPLIGMVGIGIDAGMAYFVRNKLHRAVDAAALAGGKILYHKDYKSRARTFFDSNYPTGHLGTTIKSVEFIKRGEKLTVRASVSLPTTFMHLFGKPSVIVSSEAEVVQVATKIETVIAIDMSGSMDWVAGGRRRIDVARGAAKTLVKALFKAKESGSSVKIGIVPFNGSVNVRISGAKWDGRATKKFLSRSFINPLTKKYQNYVWKTNVSRVPFLNKPNASWSGCAYARYIHDDDARNDADTKDGTVRFQGGKWVAWEARNDDSIYGPVRLLHPDGSIKTVVKFAAPGEFNRCLEHGITPLSTVKSKIVAKLNALQKPVDATIIPIGLSWAWRLLSPGPPFGQGEKITEKNRLRKAVVLLSDGSNCSAAGGAYKGYLGECKKGVSDKKVDKRAFKLAANMKKAGIEIYVVQYGDSSRSLTKVLKKIASSDKFPHYQFAPNSKRLRAAFDKIAMSLTKLRIAK